MRNPFLILPVLSLALLGAGVVKAAFPATWGPAEPTYQIVVDYRGTVAVLDHGLTEFDCHAELPYSDPRKAFTFTCEREG